MITMAKIAAGRAAWAYFMDKVSDDPAATSGKAASYYIKGGNPPGRWYGSGLTGLGLAPDAVVGGDQLERLLGTGSHPLTGDQLGRPLTEQVPLATRIQTRISALPTTLPADEQAAEVERIVGEEAARRTTSGVAGFEVVFNPPKSVSTWWALADAGLKDEILAAHHAAVQSTLAVLERDAIRTRTGTDGVAQELTGGIVAAGFDHWETREGDPQLHTHLLIANRVQGADGKWRTIDSRHALSPSIVTLSEQYDSDLMDQLSLRFGVNWTEQSISADPKRYQAWLRQEELTDTQSTRARFAMAVAGVDRKNHKWQLEEVPQELIEKFSTRAVQVRQGKDALIAAYVATHGRTPAPHTVLRMRAAAAVRTRKAKQAHTLKGLTKTWRTDAAPIVGDTFRFAARVRAAGSKRLADLNRWAFRADDVTDTNLVDAAAEALSDLATNHATWSRANARAAALRVIKPWTFRAPQDRDQVAAEIVARMLEAAIPLTPKNLLHTPRQFQLPDGSSMFHSPLTDLFTTTEVFAAEERILIAGETITDLVVSTSTLEARIGAPTPKGHTLSTDQSDALSKIARSGRAVDVLIGPAGAGKTTTLQKLREMWEADHGPGSVRGLAPTAKAAEVLADSLGIDTENTAKWIWETTNKKFHTKEFQMKTGDLIIVDEASIGGTMALDTLRRQAAEQGAKLLLVGDWAQLSAVDAGGAFGMLARHRVDPPELVEIHRFTHQWEATASTLLRLGKTAGLRPYLDAGRISWGHTDTLIHDAVQAWKADEAAGREALLVAPTNEVADQLNLIAQQWRRSQGLLSGRDVELAEGTAAEGDRIVTRENDRTLKSSTGKFVKNNAEWVVTRVNRDGSIVAVGEAGSVVLPAAYVARHVQLGYATTAHRAQGRTVDTTHSIVDAGTTRENLYVAITRGRVNNQLYVAIDPPESMEGWTDNGQEKSYLQILDGILANTGAELSAHETFTAEAERTQSIQQLAAEYDTLAQAAALPRYDQLIDALPLDPLQRGVLRESAAYGPLIAALRRADETGRGVREALPQLTASRPILDGDDPAAILHFRLTQWAAKQPVSGTVDRIGGLIARALPAEDPDMQKALETRAYLMNQRAEIVLDRALSGDEPWAALFAGAPVGEESVYRRVGVTVATYRDKYALSAEVSFLGPSAGLTATQKADRAIAQQAIDTLTGKRAESDRPPVIYRTSADQERTASIRQDVV